jgi:hypothetical protein
MDMVDRAGRMRLPTPQNKTLLRLIGDNRAAA